MIIEMRTYTLTPGRLQEVEKRFAEALPTREKHSKLAAFWHTEIGTLDQVIHIWPYESFEQRLAVRAAAVKEEGWPPRIRDFCIRQESEILFPAPFSPKLEPREVGPMFELRQDTLQAGAFPGRIERWASKIQDRQTHSPLIGAWYSEVGTLNKWVHVWAYRDMNQRFKACEAAAANGNWPPRDPPGVLLKMVSSLVMPAAFSPIR